MQTASKKFRRQASRTPEGDDRRLAEASAESTGRLIAALRDLDDDALLAPSALPGWSRLAIVCHLRYGAAAVLRMTRDALEGRETAYYPQGRARQRPNTLVPRPTERIGDVLDEWADVAGRLDGVWSSLDESDWRIDVVEPADNPDLGTVPLGRLALARLTEVDVHGTDLAIAFADWSATLVEIGLPTRLEWLATRRTNHREFDRSIEGTWHLAADEGLRWEVSVSEDRVESRPVVDGGVEPRAVIAGTRSDLLALLLGRPTRRPLGISGDVAFGESFSRAFPGP